VVVLSALVIKGNPLISSLERGSFRLGELSRISMLMVLFCMICDELGVNCRFASEGIKGLGLGYCYIECWPKCMSSLGL